MGMKMLPDVSGETPKGERCEATLLDVATRVVKHLTPYQRLSLRRQFKLNEGQHETQLVA